VATSKAGLVELLQSNKKQFDKIILDFLPRTSRTREIAELYEMMRDYPSRGGKGLRGSMCLFWCELFGGKRRDSLITAAALELFQNWILIHDDIEDQSDLRRGLPALHKRVGIELAINTGDALHGKMWEFLQQNRKLLGPDLCLDVSAEFAKMLNETTEGQQMELSWNMNNNWDIKEEDYLLMVTKKSAWYTCISPARLGILVANVNKGKLDKSVERAMDKVVSFGTDLGKSFQIIDDLLNLLAEESKYGKEILGDLFEGKRTLMIIHLLANIDGGKRGYIIDILSKPREKKTLEEIRTVLDLMKETGSLEYAKKVAGNLSKTALGEFDRIVSTQKLKVGKSYHTTRSLIEYLVARDY
jgi:geranylgeranyl diphosphate synthase, type II